MNERERRKKGKTTGKEEREKYRSVGNDSFQIQRCSSSVKAYLELACANSPTLKTKEA